MLFFILAIVILAAMWGYVWASLVVPLELPPQIHSIVAAILVGGFFLQIARWAFFRSKRDFTPLVVLAYFMLGLLSHLVLASGMKDIALLVIPISDAQHTHIVIGILSACIVANAWGTHTALSGPVVRHVNLPNSSKRPSPQNIRLVQVSDLHVGPLIREHYVQKVVDLVNSLKPDLIAVTGDLGDGNAKTLKTSLDPLKKLKSTCGVFYVTGNHEYYWNVAEWTQAVRALGFTVLTNEGRLISTTNNSIWIAGIPDKSGHRFQPEHKLDEQRARQGSPESAYRILLTHQPNSLKDIQVENWDLFLAGHTHWGQYFPFNFLVRFFNLYFKGLHRVPNSGWIYVNAGTGFWGPPLRLGVRSEITLIEWKA